MNIVTRNVATHYIIVEICMQAASYAENTVKVDMRTECSPLVEQREVQVAHQNVCWVFA